ncbi:High affinity nitrate transporter 2.7 [Linum perenne]
MIWKKKIKNHRIQQQPPPPPPPQAASPQISTPFSFSTHQIRAFHLAWFSLFSNLVSTFSIPPLLPLIRSDLHLSPSDVSSVVAASFAGSILSRLAIGPLCQLLGPATATDSLSFLTVPVIFAASLISSPNSFLAVRLLVGLSLENQFQKISVQAASGLVFGVVPFFSKRFSTQTSISLMGIMMIVCAITVTLIYFPPPQSDTIKDSKALDTDDYYRLLE